MSYHWRGRRQIEAIALLRIAKRSAESVIPDFATLSKTSLSYLAGTHRVVDGFHKMVARRFPYAIYYRVAGDCVKVYAVLDTRRNPDWIAARITGH